MKYSETFLPHFSEFCSDKFGVAKGVELFEKAEAKLGELVCEADYRNNKYIKIHMEKTMLPVIAMYLTFKEREEFTGKALEITDEIMQISRVKSAKKNKKIAKIPFSYYVFKSFYKRVISKEYPPEGWDIEWVTSNKNEVHFNMKSCIYVETTKKYNCFEVCPLFCANDDVILAGYKPKIIFERESTIAKGQDHCDFHFKNGK
ncbi:MAG: L-2-amino-thiazoline-4-carboxylic acid hydrolase [Clostridium sp.]